MSRAVTQAAQLPERDFWLFDDDLAATLFYGDDGSGDHVEMASRPSRRGAAVRGAGQSAGTVGTAGAVRDRAPDHHRRDEGSMSGSEWDGAY